MYISKHRIITYLTLCFLNCYKCVSDSLDSNILDRPRRQLLFPNSTLLQLNAGVGTPTPIKTININWAFQANFQLPWNRTQIPLDIFEANSGYTGLSRKKRDEEDKSLTHKAEDYENDARLYHFYKYVEDVLNGFGHNGSSCVLRTLCHLAAEPIKVDDDEDILHELASFVLNPKSDENENKSTSEASTYIEAYESGTSVEYCLNKYDDCKISLVDLFTKINDIS
ncbi:uncharacterized protein [Battus philenor]|uniref:uncharacterized protein n=1 Tax=Battus philenor TaxID=42288 RepID=UPI0035CF9E10